MSSEPPELGALIPGLTRSTISDDERAVLYEANRRGEHPPSHQHWQIIHDHPASVLMLIRCPGCQAEQRVPYTARRSYVACDGCSHVYLVPAKP